MNSTVFRLVIPAWGVFSLSIVVRAQDSPPGLALSARVIPVPESVSAELKKLIAGPIPPMTPMPDTAEGWKNLQREADNAVERAARAAAELMDISVEPKEVAGVKRFQVTPKQIPAAKDHGLIVHVHGGAYVFNSGMAATAEAILLAQACHMRVLSVDYRMPPDHPFPAAPDDVLAVWKALLAAHDAKNLFMGGTSAGGGLIMTTMLRCKAEKQAMPAALFLGTPGADLSKSGDSMFLNAEVDHKIGRYEGRVEACIRLYTAGRDLKDPLVSPIYGDFSGWPPTILVSGTRDLLLSATAITHRKLRAAGVVAELHVYEGMSHADYLSAHDSPEGRDVMAEIAAFFDRHLKR